MIIIRFFSHSPAIKRVITVYKDWIQVQIKAFNTQGQKEISW